MNTTTPTFPLGRIVTTPGAQSALDRARQSPAYYLDRHASCDWGDVSPGDREVNNAAAAGDGMLLSAYTTDMGDRLWVITNGDRSVTTILLPTEY